MGTFHSSSGEVRTGPAALSIFLPGFLLGVGLAQKTGSPAQKGLSRARIGVLLASPTVHIPNPKEPPCSTFFVITALRANAFLLKTLLPSVPEQAQVRAPI